LKLFTWNKTFSLHNIEIKTNSFDSLSLPFRVIHGRIGRIEANISWKALFSSPVVIKLSDIYIIALPNNGNFILILWGRPDQTVARE
jgi:vacuolar protein sorting-associated protein 13A/C